MADGMILADRSRRAKHAVVMVLGDVGRSPRMQYHALSLLEEGHYVTLIGYAGEKTLFDDEGEVSPPPPAATTDDSTGATESPRLGETLPSSPRCGRLRVLRMSPYQPPKTTALCRIFYYPLRLISLLCCVVHTLWIRLDWNAHTTVPVDVLLVQNPPSVPTLLLAYSYCLFQQVVRQRQRPRLVVDWHNLGFTMFESPGPEISRFQALTRGFIRALAGWYERKMAPLADAHMTVTKAMELWLGENFDVHGSRVRVLYDKPPAMFRPTSVEEQHELFRKLDLGNNQLDEPSVDTDQRHTRQVTEQTIFTQSIRESDGKATIQLRHDRPALIVSSTSWTPDEDFSILLDALKVLHTKVDSESDNFTFPRVLVVVTGKGPQKEHYLPLLEEFNRVHPLIRVRTLWLDPGDYPKLLGCATLGVSLHTSTSGLDLPMKVLDMFGCQVPVCAMGFDCLEELVKDGVNGKIFHNGKELANQLFDLLTGYPDFADESSAIEAYRRNIRGLKRWKENWGENARDLIVGDWVADR